jgi:methionine synthase II (cobalamin-independent)
MRMGQTRLHQADDVTEGTNARRARRAGRISPEEYAERLQEEAAAMVQRSISQRMKFAK